MKKDIELHPSPPLDYELPHSVDKSFILVLDRMLQQALDSVRRSEPCVESQHEDGVKIGKLYALQDVIKAFKEFK